jgi:hypothetical protein
MRPARSGVTRCSGGRRDHPRQVLFLMRCDCGKEESCEEEDCQEEEDRQEEVAVRRSP